MTIRFSRLALLALLIGTVFLAGCRKAPTAKKPSAATDGLSDRDSQAEQLLDSVIGILEKEPDASAFPTVLKQLNGFVARRSDAIETVDAESLTRITGLLGPQAGLTISRKTFDQADAEYLQNTLFLHSAARAIAGSEEDDLELARRLFDWVARYVQIVPTGTQMEGPPLEVCVRGTGNAYERSWIFLELLRQVGLTGCVVAMPGGESPASLAPWLCGLIDGKEVYLFEPKLGVPVQTASGSPATLRQLLAEPEAVLAALTVDPQVPYPVKPAQVKDLALLLILEPEMLAPRMAFLQSRLSGAHRASLLVDCRATLQSAFTALEGISENVRIWQYPQITRARFRANPIALYDSLNTVWLDWAQLAQVLQAAEIIRSYLPSSARLLQLTGNCEAAIETFVKLDLANIKPVVLDQVLRSLRKPTLQRRVTVANTAQDIIYFMGLSKLDLPKSPQPSVARHWFDRYLAKYNLPTLHRNDVLNPKGLVQKLLAARSDKQASPARRVWETLTEEEKKAVLSGDPGKTLVALNALLEKPGLYHAEDFKAALSTMETPADLRRLIEVDPKQLTAIDLRRRNRLLLDVVFPDELVCGTWIWLPGAIRHKALALYEEGKGSEAIALLRQDHPGLAPIHRASLLALAALWERESKQ